MEFRFIVMELMFVVMFVVIFVRCLCGVVSGQEIEVCGDGIDVSSSSVVSFNRNPPTGRRQDSPIILITVFARPTHVRSRFRSLQQSQSYPYPAGKDSPTSSPILTEAGTSVWLLYQSRSLLLLADKSNGVGVRMKLFRDLNLLAAGR